MGGYGSGRRCTNELETSYRKLDIRLLAREGVLAAGSECSVRWSGRPPELLRIQASEGVLHFRYDTNPQSWQRGEIDLVGNATRGNLIPPRFTGSSFAPGLPGIVRRAP